MYNQWSTLKLNDLYVSHEMQGDLYKGIKIHSEWIKLIQSLFIIDHYFGST